MNLRVFFFTILVAAQIAVPLHMIQQRESVLRDGELFRFKTEPIDPVDPFQGRYVWLRIEEDYAPLSALETEGIAYNATGYATLGTDAEGFAHFTAWTHEKPTETSSFLRTTALGPEKRWEEREDGTRQAAHQGLSIRIPFTRFYMDEAKAPRAEIRAREAARNKDCWVAVRILNGKAVIEDVIAKGQSLRDLASIKK